MSINRSTLRVERELHNLTSSILDAQTRALVEAWVLAWDQVSGEVNSAMMDLASQARNGRVTRTAVQRSQRTQAALAAVAESLEHVSRATGDIISADLFAAVQAAADAEVGMIETQLSGVTRADLRANLVRADTWQISAMVERATQQITAVTWPISAEATASIRRELLRGIAVGENPIPVARRMVRGIEGRFDGGLARALVISRTEILSAMRDAALAADQANRDVVVGWTWLAHLDANTCMSCIANHGQEFDVDVPGPIDHHQGRCARAPRVKTWAELGYPNISDPPDLIPDADAWFEGLTEDQQRSILSNAGFDAWKAGRFPREQWTTRRKNPGWRDSMVPARPPKAA